MPRKYILNPHAGDMLKEEFLKPFNISQNALAKAIFVPANRIHQIISGKRRVTADTDLRLCRFFGLSDGFFLRVQLTYEMTEERRKRNKDIDKIQKYDYKETDFEERTDL